MRNRLLAAAGDRLIDVRNQRAPGTGLRHAAAAFRAGVAGSSLIYWRKSTARPRCSCARARPTRRGEARRSIWRATPCSWSRRGSTGAASTDGRVFRSVRKDGTVGEQLDASQVPRIYKRMARHAGLPGDIVDALAGHSTRVGPVQDMIASGIELPAILQSGRWQTTRMVHRYGERLLARRSGAAQLAERQQR